MSAYSYLIAQVNEESRASRVQGKPRVEILKVNYFNNQYLTVTVRVGEQSTMIWIKHTRGRIRHTDFIPDYASYASPAAQRLLQLLYEHAQSNKSKIEPEKKGLFVRIVGWFRGR